MTYTTSLVKLPQDHRGLSVRICRKSGSDLYRSGVDDIAADDAPAGFTW